MNQYCVYTRDFAHTQGIFRDFAVYRVSEYEAHFNRTRFWLNFDDPLNTVFFVKWHAWIHSIDHETDHVLGV